MQLSKQFAFAIVFSLPKILAAYIDEHAIKHAWPGIPDGWDIHSIPAPNHPITMKIGLKQNRIDDLIKTLHEVSDPLHPNYGQHLSRL